MSIDTIEQPPAAQAPATPPVDTATIEHRVEQYVKLRDTIRELDDAHKTKMAPFREMLERLNGVLLDHLNQVGVDSARTGAGTVYRTEKKSASLADKTAFLTWIQVSGEWDMLDYKANPTAVQAFMDENNGALPPGVNWSNTFVVGVRRGNA